MNEDLLKRRVERVLIAASRHRNAMAQAEAEKKRGDEEKERQWVNTENYWLDQVTALLVDCYQSGREDLADEHTKAWTGVERRTTSRLIHKQLDCEGTLQCPGCEDCDPDWKAANVTTAWRQS